MSGFSHLDERGRARMVDVGGKPVTRRTALAEAWVVLGRDVLEKLLAGDLSKGDALAVARVAGIQGAKRTSEWIPLCHPLALDHVRVDFEAERETGRLRVLAETSCRASTGVEMEALCAVSAAALALYDLCKALERGIRIEGIRLLRKEGGRSGIWEAEGGEPEEGGGS